ncbi:hypothetical protein Sphch_3627 [Sphingobium chlorophenolicum L-1]|uniref:DUF1214 domain-containing protein n=1 Tax=Sphingobium chlorophenolicum L-1 TaxID=690566 RepID=F6F101_SPHCR|nr:hypothetical protein [Sphingobium chlorophenolicum]AEG51217.1 hypothetical protein Sphch_3627 [Sphingobium chlorophenolicum L-1]
MTTNPIANADQFTAEAEVRAMWDYPATKAARDHCAQLWRVGHGNDVPPQVEPLFDAAMDAWIGNYLFKAAARDPVRPRFVRNFMPAHSWNGAAVPDARMGGDNPDNCYRLAGIAHGGRYRISGRVVNACPAHVSFTLVENWGTSMTVQTVELPGIDVARDGSFTITIDDRPADGRPNHMTTNPRVKFLFVRDSMMDWERETPLALQIERIDATGAQPLSFEERLDEALRRAREDVPLYYWFFRLSAARAVNSMPQPMRTASVGGLVTQASSIGRLRLEDDQAAIIRFDPAGAAYNSLQLAMWWYRSVDAHLLQSGLSAAQAVRDGDGLITTVVSAYDPGVANWVQTDGLRDLLPMIRWQGLPERQQGRGPVHWLDIVPLDRIAAHLPDGVARMDPQQRQAQIADRRATWSRRTAI